MSTSLKLAICLDGSMSTTSHSNACSKLNSFWRDNFLHDQNNVQAALVGFQSYGNPSIVLVHPFTSSINQITGQINNMQVEATNQHSEKAIARALTVAQELDWNNSDNEMDEHQENLMILITDGRLNGRPENYTNRGQYLWDMTQKFAEKNIVLVVAGIEPGIVGNEDLYCAFAKQTGGEYIPFNNFMRLLPSIIKKCTEGEDTLPEIFRSLDMKMDIEHDALYRYRHIETRVRFMIENCAKMADVQQEFVDTNSETNLMYGNINDYDNEIDYEPSYRFPAYYNNAVFSFPSINGSMPSIEDEAYLAG